MTETAVKKWLHVANAALLMSVVFINSHLFSVATFPDDISPVC